METAKLILEYIEALIWPAIVLFGLISFRTQIGSAFSRLKHAEGPPNAGMPWTKNNDARLTELFRNRTSLDELTRLFGRSRGAIISRLKHLRLYQR